MQQEKDNNESYGVDIGGRFTLVAKGNYLRADVVLTDGQRRELENVIVFKDHVRLIGTLGAESYRQNILNSQRGFSNYQQKIFQYNGQQLKQESYQLLGAFLRSILKEKKNIVISYPDFFTQLELVNLWKAIQISRADIIAAIPENMAISTYVNYCQNIVQSRNLIIIDFGHTKFSAFLLKQENVICEVFDRKLGAQTFDITLTEWILNQKNIKNIDFNNKNHLKLIDSCEKNRKELSANQDTTIDVEWIDFYCTLKRDQYKEIMKSHLEQLYQLCLSLQNQTQNQQIDLIITLGGGSRMPIVQEVFRSVFSNIEFQSTIHATEAICQGCAITPTIIQQRQQNNNKEYFYNIYEPYPIYIGQCNGNIAIPQNDLRDFFIQNGQCIKYHHGVKLQLDPKQYYKIVIFYLIPPSPYSSIIRVYEIQNLQTITCYYDNYGIIQICSQNQIIIPLDDQNKDLIDMINLEDEMELRDNESVQVDEIKYQFEKKIIEIEKKAQQQNLNIRQYERLGQYIDEAKQYLLQNNQTVINIQEIMKEFINNCRQFVK